MKMPIPVSPKTLGLDKITPAGNRVYCPDFMEIFNPYGKLEMLKGGIGCVRLKDKLVENERVWFMTASSTCNAHEGFPIALPDHFYPGVIDQISARGIKPCTITGKLRFVPDVLNTLYEDYTRVPQLYLMVEDLRPSTRSPRPGEIPRVSGAVSFRSKFEGKSNIFYSYVTFFPSQPGSLASRVDWLENIYVKSMYQGQVITDFDEHNHRFETAVFSLKKVLEHQVTIQEALEFTRTLIIHGDPNIVLKGIANINAERIVHLTQEKNISIGNISNSIVNIESTLEHVHQSIASANSLDEATRQQLKELVDQLSVELKKAPEAKAADAEAVADAAKALVEAGTKPKPNQTTLQITGEGLKKAAQNIAGVMPTVLTIATGIIKTIANLTGIPLP
jgi:hypothetical protein